MNPSCIPSCLHGVLVQDNESLAEFCMCDHGFEQSLDFNFCSYELRQSQCDIYTNISPAVFWGLALIVCWIIFVVSLCAYQYGNINLQSNVSHLLVGLGMQVGLLTTIFVIQVVSPGIATPVSRPSSRPVRL